MASCILLGGRSTVHDNIQKHSFRRLTSYNRDDPRAKSSSRACRRSQPVVSSSQTRTSPTSSRSCRQCLIVAKEFHRAITFIVEGDIKCKDNLKAALDYAQILLCEQGKRQQSGRIQPEILSWSSKLGMIFVTDTHMESIRLHERYTQSVISYFNSETG